MIDEDLELEMAMWFMWTLASCWCELDPKQPKQGHLNTCNYDRKN
jgi:hypothetical protein